VAIAAACRALAALPAGALEAHEQVLFQQLTSGLDALGIDRLQVWPGHADHVGIATFAVDGYAADEVATYLSAEHGIGVRDGRFCAHPLLSRLGAGAGAVRASLGVGSSTGDVDALLAALRQLLTDGPGWSYRRDNGVLVPAPDDRALPAWAGAAAPEAAPAPCAV
jgi:selenocysteine lyase/cysteine desulfurase